MIQSLIEINQIKLCLCRTRNDEFRRRRCLFRLFEESLHSKVLSFIDHSFIVSSV